MEKSASRASAPFKLSSGFKIPAKIRHLTKNQIQWLQRREKTLLLGVQQEFDFHGPSGLEPMYTALLESEIPELQQCLVQVESGQSIER